MRRSTLRAGDDNYVFERSSVDASCSKVSYTSTSKAYSYSNLRFRRRVALCTLEQLTENKDRNNDNPKEDQGDDKTRE